MSKFRAFPLLIVLALVLAVMTYAFAAANTVTPSVAGDGEGTISGVVATVHYVLAANPAYIHAVQLSLDKPVTQVSASMLPTVKVSFDGTNWYDCTGADQSWTCNMPTDTTASVASVTTLRLITAQ